MKNTLLVLLVLLTTACHNNKQQRPNYAAFIESEGLVGVKRVQQFRFQGWQPLDDRHLILSSSHRKGYLIKLMSVCTELGFTNHIKLKQEFSTILNAKFDSIIVPGQFNQECTIDRIYKLDEAQKQALQELDDKPPVMRMSKSASL